MKILIQRGSNFQKSKYFFSKNKHKNNNLKKIKNYIPTNCIIS